MKAVCEIDSVLTFYALRLLVRYEMTFTEGSKVVLNMIRHRTSRIRKSATIRSFPKAVGALRDCMRSFNGLRSQVGEQTENNPQERSQPERSCIRSSSKSLSTFKRKLIKFEGFNFPSVGRLSIRSLFKAPSYCLREISDHWERRTG